MLPSPHTSRRRVLITGGTGLLGKALLEAVPEAMEATATWHRRPPQEWAHRFLPLEVTDPAAVRQLLSETRPNAVIHAASIGAVDEAERDPERVWQINVLGTQHIAEAARRAGAFLVYISSNAVFDGTSPPYREDAPLRPANRYGALKAEAEERIRASAAAHLIVRPILLYGWPFPGGRENVVARWLTDLEQGRTVRAAQDLFSMPLLVTQCAQVIWEALARGLEGFLHVAGADRISLFEFAREVARAFDCPQGLVVPVPGNELPVLAARPPDTSFVTDRVQRDLGIRPIGVREGLQLMRRARIPVA